MVFDQVLSPCSTIPSRSSNHNFPHHLPPNLHYLMAFCQCLQPHLQWRLRWLQLQCFGSQKQSQLLRWGHQNCQALGPCCTTRENASHAHSSTHVAARTGKIASFATCALPTKRKSA